MNVLLTFAAATLVVFNQLSFAQRRIIGGHPVKIESAPYQVALLDNNGHRCGGSLISESFVLTAAHCTSKINTLINI